MRSTRKITRKRNNWRNFWELERGNLQGVDCDCGERVPAIHELVALCVHVGRERLAFTRKEGQCDLALRCIGADDLNVEVTKEVVRVLLHQIHGFDFVRVAGEAREGEGVVHVALHARFGVNTACLGRTNTACLLVERVLLSLPRCRC